MDLHRWYRPIQPGDAGRIEAGYREISPHPSLAPYVACYWSMGGDSATLETPIGGSSPVLAPAVSAGYRVVPDGCMDMLFTWEAGGAFTGSSLCGAFDKPFDAGRSWPREQHFGIRFVPGGLYRLLRIPAFEFTDLLTPLEDAAGRSAAELAECLSACRTVGERARGADRYLRERIRSTDALPMDGTVGYALYELYRSGGAMPVAELARRCAVSERQLGRLFRRWTGLAPKPFGRIVRFQSILARLEGGGIHTDWTTIAGQYGFADQAHFIRDFKSLYGGTPTAAVRSSGERGPSLSDLFNTAAEPF